MAHTTDAPAGESDPTTEDLVARGAALPVANIADAMERMGVLAHVRPMWAGARVAGPAFTVLTRSGDNAFVHRALDAARAGEVIVVNGQGDETRALVGELMGVRAHARGIAGFVIDGAVRDVAALREIGIPVFARAATPAGPYKHGPGALGRPIAVGCVAVLPGDLVFGDDDGVVIVPRADAPAVLAAAEEILRSETARRAVAQTGAVF